MLSAQTPGAEQLELRLARDLMSQLRAVEGVARRSLLIAARHGCAYSSRSSSSMLNAVLTLLMFFVLSLAPLIIGFCIIVFAGCL